MKKLTYEQRLYSLRVTPKRTARGRRSQTFKTQGSASAEHSAEEIVETILAPEIFGIETHERRRELVRFLKKLRERARSHRIQIDFSVTDKMQAAGTLLLAAELDRINAEFPERRVTCTYPRDAIVAQVLCHVGIFELLGVAWKPKITAESVKYWKVHSGNAVDGESAGRAIAAYEHRMSTKEHQKLYGALTEAMTNCRHHAYLGQEDAQVQKWWMFSLELDGGLTMCVCDLGIGIPKSLRANRGGLLDPIVEWIVNVRGSLCDAQLIRGAMEVGRSRTKEDHRGRGLMDMRAALDGLHGHLQIFSGRGFYQYKAETGEVTWKNYDKSMTVPGTLILWRIPLAPAATVAA